MRDTSTFASSSSSSSSYTMPIPDLDSLMVLEAPFVRGPYEDLRRRLRIHQRITDREFASINATLRDVEASSSTREELLDKVEAVIARVKGIKEKLCPLVDDFSSSLVSVQQRTSHLAHAHLIRQQAADASTNANNDPGPVDESQATSKANAADSYQQYTDVRLQRMTVDWLCRMGLTRSAERLVKSKGLESFTDVALFKELFAIRDSLMPPPGSNHKSSCTLALAWCADNKAALRRIKSTLEFDLRLQEFVNLCQNRSTDSLFAARTHLRKHLLPVFKTASDTVNNHKDTSLDVRSATTSTWSTGGIPAQKEQDKDKDREEEGDRDHRNNVKILTDVTRAFGILATPRMYQDLFDAVRLPNLFEQLFAAAMSIYSLSPQPTLNIALSAGLSSLKVPACYGGERKLNKQTDRSATGSADTGSEATAPTSLLTSSVVESEDGTVAGSAEGGASAAVPATVTPMPGVGEVDEELMRDVRREVRAENDKYRQQITTSATGAEDGDDTSPASHMYETRNLNCPICTTIRLTKPISPLASSSTTGAADTEGLGLGILAKEIPWSHHSNSTIVCRISGRVIDEGSEQGDGGQAVALPNGRVYSKRALEVYSASLNESALTSSSSSARRRRLESKSSSSLSAAAATPSVSVSVAGTGGATTNAQCFVTCPRTRDRFFAGQMRRVYIS